MEAFTLQVLVDRTLKGPPRPWLREGNNLDVTCKWNIIASYLASGVHRVNDDVFSAIGRTDLEQPSARMGCPGLVGLATWLPNGVCLYRIRRVHRNRGEGMPHDAS